MIASRGIALTRGQPHLGPDIFFHPFIVFSFFQLRLVDIRRRDSIIGNLYHGFCLKGRISQDMSMDIQLLMSCAQESHQLLDMRASVKSIHLCKALS